MPSSHPPSAQSGDMKLPIIGTKRKPLETECNAKYRMALLVAARNGHRSFVKGLLKEKAQFDSELYAGHFLKGHRMEVLYRMAVDSIIDLKGPDQKEFMESLRGRTPLACAAEGGHTEVVRLLLDKEDVCEKDADGKTALHWAAHGGHEEIVETLLFRGAEVEVADVTGNTPRCLAAQKGHSVTVALLRKYSDNTHVADENALLEFVQAMVSKEQPSPQEPGIIQRLIRQGADIEARDERGLTPVHLAVVDRRVELMEQLLDCGADIEARNCRGITPLFIAAARSNLEITKRLIDRNADVNASDRRTHDMTPVDYAVGYNDPRVVQSSEKRRVVELLLDRKADITMRKGRERWSALGVAISAGSVEMGRTNTMGGNALSWAAARGNEAVFDRLLKALGIGWDDADWLGRTPIFSTIIAENKGFKGFCKRLISRGSNVHRRDRFGLTPLFLAVQHGHEDLVQQILSKHPLTEEPRDRYGRGLSWWMQETGNIRLRDVLVQCGMQLEASQGEQEPTWRRSKGSCDVCTLNVTQNSQNITSGSGRQGYKICCVYYKFGAGRAEFAGI